MLLKIENVLDANQVALCRDKLAQAKWADGRITAGYQSAQAKHNLQLPESDPLARELGAVVTDALAKNSLFFTSALPKRIFPPLFNCYRSGQSFGNHIDNAVRYDRSMRRATPVRTDLSATLFLNDPADYDGGELIVEDTYGTHSIKLSAGDMVVYPASSLHRVEAITRGERLASFFWIQSMVRDDGERALLFNLDVAIQRLNGEHAQHPSMVELVGVYHNLLRRWAEV